MKRTIVAMTVLMCLARPAMAQNASSIIAGATKAMGAEGVNAITYYGSGANYNLGQSNDANGPWPRVNLNDYRRTLDFSQPASRASAVTFAAPPQGTPATQGAFNQLITPANQTWAQQLEIWITPWGFLRGAAANSATTRTQTAGGRRTHVVSFNAPVKSPGGAPYRVVGYIDAQTQHVDRVETWLENPFFGDMHVEAIYTGWRTGLNGVRFPSTIVQRRAGQPTFEAQILGADANPANLTELMTPPPPAGGRGAAPGGGAPGGQPAPPAVSSEKIADGVYRILGGYVALAVEFRDHAVIFEPGPQNEARALAIIGEVKKLMPGKPIRYGIPSHHHLDHTGGTAAVVSEGITLVVHENNKAYFERAMTSPRTLAPDALAKSGKKPVIETMRDKRVFTDGTRTLEIHEIKGLPHADGLVIAYLPKERIVAFADLFNLPAPNAAPAPPTTSHIAFVHNLERLKLDYDTVVSVHAPTPDRPIKKADLTAGVTLPSVK